MAQPAVLDVARLIDERKISWFNVQVILLSFLVIFVDGYDIGAIGFAAPELVKAWHIADRSALGPVFGASVFGMLFGCPAFGYIGDRFGRKKAIIFSCLLFGICTWLAVFATNLTELLYLRFLAGLGIGGLFPNIIAINTEFAPKRLRASLTLIVLIGTPIGGGVPGVVAAWLVPHYGWTILFILGGILPIAMAFACAAWLPESLKYLALSETRRQAAIKLVQRLRPGLPIAGDVRFAIEDEKQFASPSPKHLFADGFGWITPLLWLLFALNLMGYFFLLSWTPTLLVSANLPVAKAAIATSFLQLGGAIACVALMRPIDKKGLLPIVAVTALAVPVVGSIGYLGAVSEPLLMIATFLAGFCVLGAQSGLNVVSGVIYPTSLRAVGAGWASGIGRFGSIAGAVVGGFLAALPVQKLYLFVALSFAITTLVCFILMRLLTARTAARSVAAPAMAIARSHLQAGGVP